MLQQVKRPCYVACLHKVASSAYQASNLSQVDYCYKLAGNGSPLDLLWYEGEEIPVSIKEIDYEGTNLDDDDDDIEDEESTGEEEDLTNGD